MITAHGQPVCFFLVVRRREGTYTIGIALLHHLHWRRHHSRHEDRRDNGEELHLCGTVRDRFCFLASRGDVVASFLVLGAALLCVVWREDGAGREGRGLASNTGKSPSPRRRRRHVG